MTRVTLIRLITVTLSMLIVECLSAQNSSVDQISAVELPPVNIADPIQAQGGWVGAVAAQYVPALDGSGLISLDRTTKAHILLGGMFSAGWDSNPDNQQHGSSSGEFTFSPYLGLQRNTSRTQYLLQYVPTFTKYSSNVYSSQLLNRASARVLGVLSERWRWDVNADGSYGQDSLRLLVPPEGVVVGQIPGIGPNAAAYRANAGNVTFIEGGAGVQYARSERDSISLHVGDSYSHFSGLHGNNSIATTRLSYDRKMSPILGMAAYGQMFYGYGAINCTSVGGGIGVTWTIRERTSLQLSGGPQVNSAACGNQLGFIFSGQFSARLSAKSQFYGLASREFGTYYLGPGLWQNSISAGYQRQLGLVGVFTADAGYTQSDSLIASGSYHGTFYDAAFSRPLWRGFLSSISYRRYSGRTGSNDLSRDIAMFSITWSPNTRNLFR